MRSTSQDERGQRKVKAGVMSSWRVFRYFILLMAVALVDLSGCREQTRVATAVSLVRPLKQGAAPSLFRHVRLGGRGAHFYNGARGRVEARHVD